jgi:deubiquitinase DESI2
MGASLLHSGVVVNGKEYAYGGHDKRAMTGVYWTRPKAEPPGGTFRCEVLQGFTIAPQNEIDAIITNASEVFQGTSYNILTKNCNHFTAYLCEKLTGRPGPGWLNRAASICMALPCVVPKEWIATPDFDTADGVLLDEEEGDERSRMLGDRSNRRHSIEDSRTGDEIADEEEWNSEEERQHGGSGKGKAPLRDTSGRVVPASEVAPLPKRMRSINSS